MNNYTKIIVVALILLFISILNEFNNPLANSNPSFIDYIHILVTRYIHYLIYLLSTFYLLFFYGIGTKYDIYFFLIIVITIVLGWYIFELCVLSYIELLFYNTNTEKMKTTFHPAFYYIFGSYREYNMYITGILFIINCFILLYWLPSVKIYYKLLYAMFVLYFFIHGIIHNIYNINYYSTKNKQSLFIKNLHDKYVSYLTAPK